ncbi:hypothetical protein E1265_07050 [Streptomyces sp. 8K308]|uniref:hypothetical protein n=1 Tax=Streptomyces sp. 8K308 TaxID=2530388 RepID=UPI00104DA6E8|nr:hypothetical protein [Streptomyces sp. 8K308]TDC25407.1 hypothetical protein E1265_07050 [Streptomyces sp. 8K308]
MPDPHPNLPQRTLGRDIGLGHRDHPLLGHVVLDTETNRTGILRALCPELPDGGAPDLREQMMAWLAPLNGGREWTTSPAAIRDQPLAARILGRLR